MTLSMKPVYLDYQATTPMDPRVCEAMLPFLHEEFGNPHSTGHAYGWFASDAVAVARGQVADLLNADDDEIVFTSGATESCNLAIRGALKAATPERRRIITVVTEHPAVRETVDDLQADGCDVTVLPVDSRGVLALDELERAVDERTLLVSVMAANNEIGVIQPLAEIADLCHRVGAFLHTDATQAVGRTPVDVDRWKVDLLSLSGHKVYGPKGIGALFVRSGVSIRPVSTGGGQEHGLRAGTVPTALAVGLGRACALAQVEGGEDEWRMARLSASLLAELSEGHPTMRLFGHPSMRVAGNLSIGFPGVRSEELVDRVSREIAISTGSACSSATAEPSKVLLALGLEPEVAATGVRVSLGRFTTEEDTKVAADALLSVQVVGA